MKILVILERIYPTPGNNALVFSPLLPLLCKEHEVFIFSTEPIKYETDETNYPTEWCGCKVFYPRLRAGRKGILAKISPSLDESLRTFRSLRKSVRQLDSQYHFDGVITTFKHNEQVCAALKVKTRRKILYIMDPMRVLTEENYPRRKKAYWKHVLSAQDTVLTTPFIKDRLERSGLVKKQSITALAFPKVIDQSFSRKLPEDGYIRLLFNGWLYSDIRSPKFFLEILSRLDERFIVTFMGRECQKLTEQFEIQTKAKLVTLPHQPYDVALQALADADILINIGNSVPVHLPSKTLEYINTGKPFVNFYKLDDCPTLYYTSRYPLCLNMSEKQSDLDEAARQFIQFCVENKGKTLDRALIEREFADCTPRYIAETILNAFAKK